MEKIMGKARHLILIMLFIILSNSLFANIPIKGHVTDFNNEPLPGAVIMVKGTAQGTITNANGDYTFLYKQNVEAVTLAVSFMGYKTVEREVSAKQSTAGMSNPTKNVNYNSIFVDENNDVYVTCNGSFGMYSDHHCGILRIKSGETEFDPDYVFDLTDATIANDGNTMKYFGHMAYAGNGILYAGVHVPAYESESGYNPLSDRTEMAVEINLYNKTIKNIGLPRSNGYANAIGLYDDYLVYGVSSDTDNGFYTYDTKTGEISSESVVKTTGYPYIFRKLE